MIVRVLFGQPVEVGGVKEAPVALESASGFDIGSKWFQKAVDRWKPDEDYAGFAVVDIEVDETKVRDLCLLKPPVVKGVVKEEKPGVDRRRGAMRISDLQDNQVVRARWGRAGETAPDFGLWRDVSLYVQRDKRGNVVVVALRLPEGKDWAEYTPKDFEQGLLLVEDYYLEIEGLVGG